MESILRNISNRDIQLFLKRQIEHAKKLDMNQFCTIYTETLLRTWSAQELFGEKQRLFHKLAMALHTWDTDSAELMLYKFYKKVLSNRKMFRVDEWCSIPYNSSFLNESYVKFFNFLINLCPHSNASSVIDVVKSFILFYQRKSIRSIFFRLFFLFGKDFFLLKFRPKI